MTTLFLTPGDDFLYTANIVDEDGDPFDLGLCTLWFTVKRHKADTDTDAIAKLYWVSSGGAAGITVATPSNGEALIRLTSAQTAAFTQVAHVWDLQLNDASSVVRTVDSGVLVVRPGVTTRTTTP